MTGAKRIDDNPQSASGLTIGRHLVEMEKQIPQATGEFTNLLWDLTIAFMIISEEVNKAGLAEVLGLTGHQNVHGEAVQRLDILAHETIFKAMDHGGHLCLMASEENENIMYSINEAYFASSESPSRHRQA